MKKWIENCTGFEWDSGNSDKNLIRHNVTNRECEQLFFNKPIVFAKDSKHSQKEERFYTLGRTDSNRFLFIVFTIRNNLIRVISARDMNLKERKKYNEALKRYSKI